ncbi:MAG: Mor transcription activator family protein [Oscillospiraceae bacterium]
MMNQDKITIEELDGEQREIAECIGLESYLKLVEHFGGGRIYIQKKDTIMRNARDDKIRKLFNGSNYRSLALMFNLSEGYVRFILRNYGTKY